MLIPTPHSGWLSFEKSSLGESVVNSSTEDFVVVDVVVSSSTSSIGVGVVNGVVAFTSLLKFLILGFSDVGIDETVPELKTLGAWSKYIDHGSVQINELMRVKRGKTRVYIEEQIL